MDTDRSHWSMEPLQILVVSPYEYMRDNLRYALDFFGEAAIDDAIGRSTALMRIARSTPDLIVAELDWPRAEALHLISDIRGGQTGLPTTTPIILLTWRPTRERVLAAKYLGVDAVLQIPFTARFLQLRAVRALERHGYRGAFRDAPLGAPPPGWMPHAERRSPAGLALSQAEIEMLLRPMPELLRAG